MILRCGWALARGMENVPMLAPTSQTVLTSFQGYPGQLKLVDEDTISLLTIKNRKGTKNFPGTNHRFVEDLRNASGWNILSALLNLLCTFPPGIKPHENLHFPANWVTHVHFQYVKNIGHSWQAFLPHCIMESCLPRIG